MSSLVNCGFRHARLVLTFLALLVAMGILSFTGAPIAQAAVTVPVCPGSTVAPVDPALLELTGQNEVDFNNGKTILIYGSWGDNPWTGDPDVGEDIPPNCATRLVDGEPVSSWAFCTDAYRHSCRNNGSANFMKIGMNPKFDPALDPLGPDKERVISYILRNGYGIGGFDTFEQRADLQRIVWCVSEAGVDIKTADMASKQKVLDYLGAFCAANFNSGDFDAVLAMVPDEAQLTITTPEPKVKPGDTVRFTVTTNVVGQSITISSSGVDGPLTLCSGDASFSGGELTFPGTDATQSQSAVLCGNRQADGDMSVSGNVVPTSTKNLIWTWNVDSECQVYSAFETPPPHRLDADARVSVDSTSTPVEPDEPNEPDEPDKRAKKPRLKLTKKSKGNIFRAGQKVKFTLRVSNPSNRKVRKVKVCDTLPRGLAYVRSSPKAKLRNGRHCWNIPVLKAKSGKRLVLIARVLGGTPSKLTNRAEATSSEARRATAKDKIRIRLTETRRGGVTG